MRFSIVTPSFQNSEWLKLCIASVADQGVEHEHIVQDAGSNDGTLDWLANDSRVRAFIEKDSGMYDAINRGLRRSTGDVCAWLNCDEQYLPGTLAAVEAFFVAHPEIDLVFGDAVIVDGSGNYLCHRKMILPGLWHTWTCHLTTLSCAMFFRRNLFQDRQLKFDARWRVLGDAEWMVRCLQQNVKMAVLRRYLASFTFTGENLSLRESVRTEYRALRASAPTTARALKPLTIAHHRVRKLLGKTYSQEPFEFSLYTRQDPAQRTTRRAKHPTFRWPR